VLTCVDAQMMTVVPLVCKYCHQAFSKQDETLSAVSRHFGRLCQGLSGRCIYLFASPLTSTWPHLRCDVGLEDTAKTVSVSQ